MVQPSAGAADARPHRLAHEIQQLLCAVLAGVRQRGALASADTTARVQRPATSADLRQLAHGRHQHATRGFDLVQRAPPVRYTAGVAAYGGRRPRSALRLDAISRLAIAGRPGRIHGAVQVAERAGSPEWLTTP